MASLSTDYARKSEMQERYKRYCKDYEMQCYWRKNKIVLRDCFIKIRMFFEDDRSRILKRNYVWEAGCLLLHFKMGNHDKYIFEILPREVIFWSRKYIPLKGKIVYIKKKHKPLETLVMAMHDERRNKNGEGFREVGFEIHIS